MLIKLFVSKISFACLSIGLLTSACTDTGNLGVLGGSAADKQKKKSAEAGEAASGGEGRSQPTDTQPPPKPDVPKTKEEPSTPPDASADSSKDKKTPPPDEGTDGGKGKETTPPPDEGADGGKGKETPPDEGTDGGKPSNPSIQFKVFCEVGTMYTVHLTDPDMIFQLRDSTKKIIATGHTSADMLTTGESCNDVFGCFKMKAPALAVKGGELPKTGSGKGTFSICMADRSDISSPDTQCMSIADMKKKFGAGGKDRNDNVIINRSVEYKIENNAIEIVKWDGSIRALPTLRTQHAAFAFGSSGMCDDQGFSPLVLDLNGNGKYDLSSAFDQDAKTRFDLNNSGIQQVASWTKAGDGFLVLDVNGNGRIDDGSELFGEYSKANVPKTTSTGKGGTFPDGFAALRQYDENNDGVIDAKDTIFNKLQIWIDQNLDGLSQPKELKTLKKLKISSINVQPKASTKIVNGNPVPLETHFVRNGRKQLIGDAWLQRFIPMNKTVEINK